MICPYCKVKISEQQVEAEDGLCPECGIQISAASEFEDELEIEELEVDDLDYDEVEDKVLEFDDFGFQEFNDLEYEDLETLDGIEFFDDDEEELEVM